MSRAGASTTARPITPFHRIAAACALLLVAALLGPAGSASAAPSTGEMSYACALKSNGLLRAVTSLGECKSTETKVTFKPGPVLVCIQPSGSTRLTKNARDCKPPATFKTLPPLAGTVYFCAALPSGTLRYVTGPGQCLTGEVQVQVTPNDAAPSVTSTSPTTNATHVGTSVTPAFTFSEPVTATVASFALDCDSAAIPFSISGSTTSTVTLHPTGSLPQGAACSVTAYAAGISDVDTLDPPDNPAADRTVSFTTDTAPSLVSSSPVGDATGVATSTDIVLTFSEPIDVAADAFTLSCGGPNLAYAVTGSGTSTVSVNPTANLPQTATCSLTAPASAITDVDAGDPPDALTAALSVTFVTVDAAPSVVATTPVDGATSVSTTAALAVTFSEPVTLAAGALTLSCDSGPVTTTPGTADQITYTFTPTSALTEGDACTATVDKTKVSDVDAVDPPDHPAADRVFSFVVDTAPFVVSSSPADGATDVPATGALTVTFSEPVTVALDSFGLACNGTPVAFTFGGSGTATATLTPTGALPGAASCTLTVVASKVHDLDAGDPPDTMAANYTAGFTTVDTAPTVVSTSPADGATNVSAGATITVTFSEPVTADAGAFALACPTGTTTAFSLSGSGTAVWTLDPTGLLPTATDCTLTITGSQIHDVDTVDPPDTMTTNVIADFTVAANSAPTDLSLSASTVAENQPSATAVGTFTSTDPDPGDTFTYARVAGSGDTDNASFAIVGDELRTAASFDFEAKASYSVRVRTTDSAGNFFEKTFTITVTDVNEAPTDITLTNSSVPENQPVGTLVGTLGAVDPDVGQTHTFSVVTVASLGCGGTYADGAGFSVSTGSLVTAASLNFEVKSSYSVCVRATDSGSPVKTFDKVLTITVTNINEAPVVGGDSYSGAIGNTLAVRGVTATGPSTALTGDLPLANDSDPEGATLSVVAGTIATTGGGSATINADGTFSYLPGVGDVSQTDTFTYTVTDGLLTSTGTISVAIGADRVWWVDGAAAPGGDGRSTAPFTTLTPLNGAGGAGDPDGTGDYVFVYAAPGSYAGGLALEANQRLYGQKFGLAIGGTTLVPAGATAPTITNAAGNGLTLANGVEVQGLTVSGASADGIHGDAVTTATIGSTVTVSASTQDGIDLTGAASGGISVGATVTGSTGRSVAVSNRSGGTTTFSGAITGSGIALTSNTGATVTFTAPLTISSGTASAFSATGGGTVTASDLTSTLTSTTGSTLVVDSTTIGAAGLSFRSVSANGAANGIRLNATGSSGGLTVVGGGNTSVGGNASGGTIQNTTGAGVLLTNTAGVSLTNLTVSGTPNAPGIDGTAVAGFSFTNGTVSGSGTAKASGLHSSIAFNDDGPTVANVTGSLTVSGSVLTGGYGGGLHVVNRSGALSSVTVTNNTVQSPAAAADSVGSGVLLNLSGSTTTTATIGTGSVTGNTITGYPNGGGIILLGGNPESASAPVADFGTSGAHVLIGSNLVAGASSANPMSTQCIQVALTGRGTSYVDVTGNGTGAAPLGLNKGTCVSVDVDGAHVLTSAITGNVVKPQAQLGGAFGIAGGTDQRLLADTSVLDSAVLNATISSNTVSSSDRSGIRFLANSRGTLNAKIESNTVAAPLSTTAASVPGIRVDSGTGSSAAIDTTVCLKISSNTTAGNTAVGATTPGIGLRKQGTVATTNDFGVVGLSPNPATGPQTEAYVSGLNPASAAGTFGTGGTAVLSGSSFIPCTLSF
ncbi:hypothetical protein ASG96_16230 [Terrabacter sp. Soil810]|nr:hypothetical protein ASG96_16230 [Terrabacter sp. Soil810]